MTLSSAVYIRPHFSRLVAIVIGYRKRIIILMNYPTDNAQKVPVTESSAQPEQASQGEGQPKPGPSGFEWKSRIGLFGIPFICVSYGRDFRGKIRVAKGFLAVGPIAVGGIAIGGFAAGIMPVGLLAIGLISLGVWAFGLLAVGQMACGLVAIGQMVVGLYGLGQTGHAKYLWSPARTDMEAVAMFHTIKMMILHEGGISLREVIVGGLVWGKAWLTSDLQMMPLQWSSARALTNSPRTLNKDEQ